MSISLHNHSAICPNISLLRLKTEFFPHAFITLVVFILNRKSYLKYKKKPLALYYVQLKYF